MAWSSEDDGKLIRAHREGAINDVFAEGIGRSLDKCRARAKYLGLLDPREAIDVPPNDSAITTPLDRVVGPPSLQEEEIGLSPGEDLSKLPEMVEAIAEHGLSGIWTSATSRRGRFGWE